MIELFEALLLGVIQGLTEFLPISSSGHLLLGQYFLGMDQERFGLSFDAAIHTGTVIARSVDPVIGVSVLPPHTGVRRPTPSDALSSLDR